MNLNIPETICMISKHILLLNEGNKREPDVPEIQLY